VRDVERRIQRAEQQNATLELPVLDRASSMPRFCSPHREVFDMRWH
jgi:hypothetical protein